MSAWLINPPSSGTLTFSLRLAPSLYKGAAEAGKSAKGSDAKDDGPVSGTKCAQCGKKPQFRENGRLHKYCGKTCAKTAGVYPGNPSDTKQRGHVGMHGTDQSTTEQDPATALMLAAGVLPMGELNSSSICFDTLCFTVQCSVDNADLQPALILSENAAGECTNLGTSSLGGAFSKEKEAIGSSAGQENVSNFTSNYNNFRVLEVKDVVDFGIEIQGSNHETELGDVAGDRSQMEIRNQEPHLQGAAMT